MQRHRGCAAEAATSYARAFLATAASESRLRAELAGEAARAAAEAGDENARAHYAAQAMAADAQAVSSWLAEARELLQAADPAGALNRATLADAVAPAGEAAELVRQASLRQRLKPIG